MPLPTDSAPQHLHQHPICKFKPTFPPSDVLRVYFHNKVHTATILIKPSCPTQYNTKKPQRCTYVLFFEKYFFLFIGTGQQYKRVKKTFKSKKVKE